MTRPSAVKGRRRAGASDLSDRLFAYALLAPAAILLGLVVVLPLVRLAATSLMEMQLVSGLPPRFVGLRNFEDMWADPRFWTSLKTTLVYVLITVPGALVVGLGLAMLANLPHRRRWPVRLALLLPWALPLAFCGLIFRWFFDSQYGIVNDVLVRVGSSGPAWLIDPTLAIAATSVAIIWKTSSFVALVLLAGLQVIPGTLYEAARVDGATAFGTFRHVTLPLLAPSIMVALIFRTITALQTFDIPYAMTRGGPGGATETLAMYIHATTLDFLDFGYGSAMAMAMFVVSMIVSAVYLRFVLRSAE